MPVLNRQIEDLMEYHGHLMDRRMSHVVLEWHDYVEKEREAELSTIIAEENLKEAETRKFIENAFRDGEIKTIGTDIEAILPPVSNFGGKKARKKQTVIEKLKAFFERFFGIGSAFTAEK